MKQSCIIIMNSRKDGSAMRPRTLAPSHHWTGMLIGQYAHLGGLYLKWIDGEPHLTICKELWQQCETAFDHIMKFVKSHNLDFVVNINECEKCQGGPESCLSKAR